MQEGSTVQCNHNGPWHNAITGKSTVNPPEYLGLYTVSGLETNMVHGKPCDFIYLEERPGLGPYDITVFDELLPPMYISISMFAIETQQV